MLSCIGRTSSTSGTDGMAQTSDISSIPTSVNSVEIKVSEAAIAKADREHDAEVDTKPGQRVRSGNRPKNRRTC